MSGSNLRRAGLATSASPFLATLQQPSLALRGTSISATLSSATFKAIALPIAKPTRAKAGDADK
jgi:hypothetical protein